MILVDTALEKKEREGKPIRVAMVGAGFMGRGVALQMFQAFARGMRLVAISNRSLEGAQRAYTEAGVTDFQEVKTTGQLTDNIKKGRFSITEDAMLLCRAEGIDAVMDVTGAVEFGALVTMEAIRNKKHVVTLNAELDSTVGSLLKSLADKAGVIFTGADGDQPAVQMNLYRFVRGLGVTPVLCGNIKGLQDPSRNPTTQKGFAEKWGQNPYMVTSFADGTKVSFEQAIVANATGMRVARRGMLGPTVPTPGIPLREGIKLYPPEALKTPGIVDYIVGAEPGPGVFVIGTHENPRQKHYLNLYKLGEGPFYLFYTPYHLCHFEAPNSIARAVLFGDAALASAGAPQVEVVTTAKVDLKAGQTVDALGGYFTYGQCENADVTHRERLLPMGLAEGCVLKKDIAKDRTLTYDDITLPTSRLCDELRRKQDEYFTKTVSSRRTQ